MQCLPVYIWVVGFGYVHVIFLSIARGFSTGFQFFSVSFLGICLLLFLSLYILYLFLIIVQVQCWNQILDFFHVNHFTSTCIAGVSAAFRLYLCSILSVQSLTLSQLPLHDTTSLHFHILRRGYPGFYGIIIDLVWFSYPPTVTVSLHVLS